jgi:hypothetical protein
MVYSQRKMIELQAAEIESMVESHFNLRKIHEQRHELVLNRRVEIEL